MQEMKPVNGFIDSFNISGYSQEGLFMNSNYITETIRDFGTNEPTLWRDSFKKNLDRNVIEAKIVHTYDGLELPLKRFSVNREMQTLEFAGLYGYNEKSMLRLNLLNSLMSQIQDENIARIDVALDFDVEVPKKVKTSISKFRKRTYQYMNTTYNKSEKEKKSNPHLNICTYRKDKKNNELVNPVERLEFSFKGSYFRRKYKVLDLEKAIKKMEKTIKRITGLNVEILPLSSSYKLLCMFFLKK